MRLLQKIKNLFKRGDDGADQREKEQKAADDRLNDYLADKNRRDKALQQTLFNELHSRDHNKERKDAEERLNEDLKMQREREENRQKVEIQRVEEQKIEEIHRSKKEPQGIREQKKRDTEIQFQRQENEMQHIQKRVAEETTKSEQQRIIEQAQREEERKKAEEKNRLDRIKAEEEQQRAAERKRIEKERLIQIHDLYIDHYHDFLIEAEVFRKEFGKNIHCDVCGRWEETELIVHRKQTYCERCIPPSYNRTNERKVIAGRHGSSKNFIEK